MVGTILLGGGSGLAHARLVSDLAHDGVVERCRQQTEVDRLLVIDPMLTARQALKSLEMRSLDRLFVHATP